MGMAGWMCSWGSSMFGIWSEFMFPGWCDTVNTEMKQRKTDKNKGG